MIMLTHRTGHQCLSATSPLGTDGHAYSFNLSVESPMPFGNESTWDGVDEDEYGQIVWQVTNAFRQRVHLGPTFAAMPLLR